MPKSDTWPGGAAMDSGVNMDSAGSCDSVISANSACSDDSMDHLSPEERACLVYLEEMIEAMEVQEDSGLSNDEPEPPTHTSRGKGIDVAGLISNSRRAERISRGNKSVDPVLSGASDLSPGSSSRETLMVESPSKGGEEKSSGGMNLALIPPPSDFMDVPQTSRSPGPRSEAPRAPVEVEQLRQRAALKGHQHKPDALAETPSLVSPPRTPPAVAPKPKKLPANIVLKSHRFSGSDSSLNLSPPAGGDRNMIDHQKVRMEALRKLGLLKSDEKEPSPLLSPNHTPKTRNSWAAPTSPASPRSPQIPLTPPKRPSDQDFLPAPAAFCDPTPQISKPAWSSPPELLLTPPRVTKSATLERSGPGLSSINELNPADLRNTRPRPASLGSRNEFSKVQGPRPGAGKEMDTRRSLPAQGTSQKLPRSQGISVLICPRAENEEDRRKALRKLGLIRD